LEPIERPLGGRVLPIATLRGSGGACGLHESVAGLCHLHEPLRTVTWVEHHSTNFTELLSV
jgi:hypothetical protein